MQISAGQPQKQNSKQLQKYLAEYVGTFALVFCGTGAIIINQITNNTVSHLGIGITFGLIVTAMIYSLGDISGAHLNPAVSFGFWASGRFPLKELFPYIVVQLCGAFTASMFLKLIFPAVEDYGTTRPLGSPYQSFVLEMILTFLLMFVIINVSTGSKETGVFAGIAVGATVMLEAVFAGPITGASMNPARSIAPAIVSRYYIDLWVYIAGPLSGAILAVWICSGLRPDITKD